MVIARRPLTGAPYGRSVEKFPPRSNLVVNQETREATDDAHFERRRPAAARTVARHACSGVVRKTPTHRRKDRTRRLRIASADSWDLPSGQVFSAFSARTIGQATSRTNSSGSRAAIAVAKRRSRFSAGPRCPAVSSFAWGTSTASVARSGADPSETSTWVSGPTSAKFD